MTSKSQLIKNLAANLNQHLNNLYWVDDVSELVGPLYRKHYIVKCHINGNNVSDLSQFIVRSPSLSIDELKESKLIDRFPFAVAARSDHKFDETRMDLRYYELLINNRNIDAKTRVEASKRDDSLLPHFYEMRDLTDDQVREIIEGNSRLYALKKYNVDICQFRTKGSSFKSLFESSTFFNRVNGGPGPISVKTDFQTAHFNRINSSRIVAYMIGQSIPVKTKFSNGVIEDALYLYLSQNYDDGYENIHTLKEFTDGEIVRAIENHKYRDTGIDNDTKEFLVKRQSVLNLYDDLKGDLNLKSLKLLKRCSDKVDLERVDVNIPDDIWMTYPKRLYNLITGNPLLFDLTPYAKKLRLIESLVEINIDLAMLLFMVGCVYEVEFEY